LGKVDRFIAKENNAQCYKMVQLTQNLIIIFVIFQLEATQELVKTLSSQLADLRDQVSNL
jgi:hypothetical protein